MNNYYTNIIDRFIPEELKIIPETLEKARLFTISLVFFIILGLVYNLFHFFMGNFPGGVIILLQSVINLLLLLSFRSLKSLKLVTHLFCTFFLLMLASLIYFAGGITFSVSSWFILIPLFATLIIGAGQGWFWFAAIATVITGYYGLEMTGYHFPNFLTENRVSVLKFIDGYHLLGLFSAIMILSQISDSSIKKLSAIVREEKKIIHQARRELEEKNIVLAEAFRESEEKKQEIQEKSELLKNEIRL